MFPPPSPDFLHRYSCILRGGAVIERLRRQPVTALDPHLANSAFVYDPVQQATLEGIMRRILSFLMRYGTAKSRNTIKPGAG